jgi:hypothetical protein
MLRQARTPRPGSRIASTVSEVVPFFDSLSYSAPLCEIAAVQDSKPGKNFKVNRRGLLRRNHLQENP